MSAVTEAEGVAVSAQAAATVNAATMAVAQSPVRKPRFDIIPRKTIHACAAASYPLRGTFL
jgi:hypothetical protein